MLKASLRAVRARYQSDAPKELVFELENDSNVDKHVLTWYTPLDPAGDCVEVVRRAEDGTSSRIPYDGPFAKRGTPDAADFVLVPAHGSISHRFDLNESYQVSMPGEYSAAISVSVTYACGKVHSYRELVD